MQVKGIRSTGILLVGLLNLLLVVPSVSFANSVNFLGDRPTEPLRTQDGEDLTAVVAVGDARFISSPNADGENLSETPDFRETVTAYRATNDSKHFLVRSERVGWGWMRADDLLLRLRSLRVADMEFEQCQGQDPNLVQQRRMGANPALVKVVIRNNWRMEKGRGESISLYDRPSELTGEEVAKSNLFKIYYAYKLCKGSDGKQYLLVGVEPTTDPDYADQSITGWVPKAETIVWGSMTAAYYNKQNIDRRDAVQIFKTEKDLRAYLRTGETDKAIGKEDISRREPLPYYASRFPVIRMRGGNYKIAWIGDGYDTASGQIVKKSLVEGKRDSALGLANSLRQRDILFVIDSTTSMGKYFSIVANALEQFIDNLNSRETNQYRYAIAIYRDYGNITGEFELLSDFQRSNVARLLDVNMASNPKGNKDMPESMFNGIIRAIESASWRHQATRSLILIGDHGNHENDPKGRTVNDVVQALENNAILFYAINVVPNISKHRQFNRLFREQTRLVLDRHKSLGGDIFSAPRDEKEDEETAKENVIKVLSAVGSISKNLERATKEVLTEGKSFEQAEAEYGTIVTSYMREVMSKAGLKAEEIANIRQLAEEGWIAAHSVKNKEPNLTPEFLMSRNKLDEFVGFLSRMKTEVTKKTSGKGLAGAVRRHAEATTGDEIMDDETISEFLMRQFHIPFRSASTILSHNPKSLERKYRQNRKFRDELKRRICERYVMFQHIQEEKSGTANWNRGRCNSKPGVPRKWWWVSHGGE